MSAFRALRDRGAERGVALLNAPGGDRPAFVPRGEHRRVDILPRREDLHLEKHGERVKKTLLVSI